MSELLPLADSVDGSVPHFQNHDVAFVAVSRAPIDKIVAYKRRMGWNFPWVSSFGSSFNYDFHVTIDPQIAPVEYNFRDQEELEEVNPEWRGWSGEQPGLSVFAEMATTCSTPTPLTPAVSTDCGRCGSGWTGRHWVETKETCPGSTVTTSTGWAPSRAEGRTAAHDRVHRPHWAAQRDPAG